MIVITPPGLARAGYLILIMYTVYTILICGVAWGIWEIIKYKKK